MNKADLESIAYFDGHTIEEIKAMNLSHEDLCEIASICWKWAHTYGGNAHCEYLRRAARILNLSSQWRDDEHQRQVESTRRAIEDATGSYQRLHHPQTLRKD
jgi:hypothetical protein